MFSPLSVRHRLSLSDSEGHGPSAPALHKRLTRRLLQFYRRKRNKADTKVAAKTKQTWHTPSNNGNDDGESIGQDMTYRALSLVIKSCYPIDSIPAGATLHIQQNVLNTHSGQLGSLGPALCIGPFPLLDLVPEKLDISAGEQVEYKAAAGGPSRQKRPSGSPGKSGSNSKKPRKENRQSNDKAQNDANDDGDEVQSVIGSDDDDDDDEDKNEDEDEGDEADSSRDGPRFPQDPPDPKPYKCPFYKYHPARYCNCVGLRIKSISYVTQHILRCHVLKQRTMGVQETAKSTSTGDKSPYLLKTKNPKNILFYCPTCRDEFRGPGADVRFERHSACEAKTIAQTGVLLPAEFDKLKKEVTAASGNDKKWDKIWTTLYPGTSTATQYSDVEAVAPIGVDVQPHNTIPHHLFGGPVNEDHHNNPPQVFGPRMPDYMKLLDHYWDDDGVLYIFQDGHWNMANNIENLDNAPSHIPNLAPTGETTMGPPGQYNPDFLQNPSFPSSA